ncbi:MAG: hypothetical protein GY789_00140 [Hyphomicrobiales bacterium]|nr:hypothetical protein [Hyphomicrobiales bacterium]MCP5002193.1 hypothetical protein [Hyphomicrobiales bacterium]
MFWLRLSAALRPAAIILVLIIIGLALYQFLAGPSTPKRLDTSTTVSSDEASRETAAAAGAKPPRAIAPAKFATPFAQNAVHLERIAPRPPLTPTIAKDTGPRPTLLHKPLVIAAGQMVFPQGELHFKDLIVTEPDEICSAPDGSLWPCGIIARTAFRNFVGGRSLACVVPSNTWDDTLIVTCLMGKQDPAAWLASRGWVRTIDGGRYSDLERVARVEGKGIFGSDPRGIAAVPDSKIVIEPDGINPGSDPLPVPLR